jgi:Spy/CpxP family protein refolding chaperone
MRAKLPWILLAVSLLGNAVLAGAVYTLTREEDPAAKQAAHLDSVAERLNLTAEQRDGLIALRDRARARRESLSEERKQAREGRRAAFLEELAKPEFDRARIAALMEERGARRRAHFADLAAGLHAYLATLNPSQREQFLAMARERGFLRGLFGRRRHRSPSR